MLFEQADQMRLGERGFAADLVQGFDGVEMQIYEHARSGNRDRHVVRWFEVAGMGKELDKDQFDQPRQARLHKPAFVFQRNGQNAWTNLIERAKGFIVDRMNRAGITSLCMIGMLLAAFAFAADQGAVVPAPEGFTVGEKLEYRIYWGLIPVGSSSTETFWIDEQGRRLIAVRVKIKTNEFVSKLYPVDDTIETFIDPASLLPVRYCQQLCEGKLRMKEQIRFDRDRGRAYWQDLINDKSLSYAILTNTHDTVSFFYAMRDKPFKEDEIRRYSVVAGKKMSELVLTAQVFKNVKTPSQGKVSGVKLLIEAKDEGVFVKKIPSETWLAQKDNMVLKTYINVPVGKACAVLNQVYMPADMQD